MRTRTSLLARQLIAAVIFSAVAAAAIIAAGRANAADLPGYAPVGQVVSACGAQEVVILFKDGRPTVPARTPYFYCVTGTTLLPGEIPPPPEYCCH